MTVKNDEKILELKKLIEQEKKKYGKQKRFNPETCCIFELNGKVNINAINNIDKLNELLVYFNTFRLSAIDLGLEPGTYKINGFGVDQWIDDIRNKIEYIDYKNHLKQLEEKEKLLDKLLSEDKKTELELLNIENMLKGV